MVYTFVCMLGFLFHSQLIEFGACIVRIIDSTSIMLNLSNVVVEHLKAGECWMFAVDVTVCSHKG